MATNPYVGCTLWISFNFKDQVLWLYNPDHLDDRKEYIESKLRNDNDRHKYSTITNLPKWVKSSKNRDTLANKLSMLKKKSSGKLHTTKTKMHFCQLYVNAFLTRGLGAISTMKIIPVLLLLITSVNAIAQNHSPEQGNSLTPFCTKIEALQGGELSNLSLEFMDSIKIKKVIGEKIDHRDDQRYKSGFIQPGQLKAISASSICEITDHYILLVVEDKHKQLRALTVRLDGTPIESILIYDNLLYLSRDWYEYEARRYAPNRPYHYNPLSNEFTFSTIFKIRAPQYEEVLIDWKDHEDETTNRRRIKVNEAGYFTDLTYEYIESNKIVFTDFTLKSSFFQENTGKTIKNQSNHNKDKKFRIYLDREQSIELLTNTPSAHDQIIRVIPEAKGKIEVYQSITYGLNINGDGDNCELKNPTYTSDWEQLGMENDLASMKKYADDERETPEISVNDLKRKIETECGDYHLSLMHHIDRPEAILSLLRPREVILKINFTNTETNRTTTEYIIYVIADGC